MKLGGGEDEEQVCRGLFQNLQQSVERLTGQHVYLIDDVHALAEDGGGVDGLFPQCADIVHAAVGGGIQLRHVQRCGAVDGAAGLALAAGCAVNGAFAVDRLG